MPEYSYIQGLTHNSEYFYKYLAEGIASAKAEDVLLGKTYVGAEGKTLNGTMPNNGALNYTPTTSQQTIPAGYTSGGTISAVTSAIDNNIQADNIKKDIEILGVTGTYEGSGGGSGDVKLFDTVEHMQQDTTAQEGDLAVVYREELNGITEDSEFDSCIFPNTVVLSEAITDSFYISFEAVDGTWYQGDFEINPDYAYFNAWGESGHIGIEYSTADSITYTRTDGGEELQEFGTTIKWQGWGEPFNSVVGYFMKIGGNYFNGLYEYVSRSDDYFTFGNFTSISGQSYPNYVAQVAEPREKIMNILTPYLNENGYTLTYLTLVRKSITEFVAYCSTTSNAPKALLDSSFIWFNNKTYISPNGYSGESVSYKIDINTETQQCFISPITATNSVTVGGVNRKYFEEITDYTFGMWFHPQRSFLVAYDNGGSGTTTSRPVSDLSIFKYRLAPTQLDTVPDYVYEKTFYGKNGVETGNIQNNKNLDMTTLRNRIITVYDSIIKSTLANNVTDLSSMFERCSDIITIPLFDTSNVTNMYRMFNLCQNLVEIPLLDTSNVTNMSGMLANCDKLTTIPQLDTSKATNMGAMFQSCDKLITIPLINTSNVKSMSNMFSGCKSLTSIPLLDTSNVTEMAYMFENCTSLTTVPQLDISKVTNTFDVFKGCTSLSNESLNNILGICIGATSFTSTKTLKYAMGLTSAQATICQSLSNYSAFIAAGWTTGY